MFEGAFPVPVKHLGGEVKMVRFSLQWLWNINPADTVAPEPPTRVSARKRGPGRPRKRRREETSSEEEEEEEESSEGDSDSDDDSDDTDNSSDESNRGSGRRRRKKWENLTARQRAMENGGGFEGQYLELPAQSLSSRSRGSNEDLKKALEEAQLKKSENARKRRLALLKQTEETKAETVERLLMKTGTREKRKARKLAKLRAKLEASQAQQTVVKTNILHRSCFVPVPAPGSGTDRRLSLEVSFPAGSVLPQNLTWKPKQKQMTTQTSAGANPNSAAHPFTPIKPRPCANPECRRLRRFSCKSNGQPVCGQMNCYKRVSVMSANDSQVVHETTAA